MDPTTNGAGRAATLTRLSQYGLTWTTARHSSARSFDPTLRSPRCRVSSAGLSRHPVHTRSHRILDRSLLLACSEPLSPLCLFTQEELAELARRQALQDMRQERVARLRQRHMQRHHAQQTIGVREPQGVRKDFNEKSMVRLHRSASAASSLEQRQYLEPSPAAEDGADASFYLEAGSPSASRQASGPLSGQRGLSSSSSMDILAQIAPVGEISMLKKAPRAMMYSGMEGLCLPKYPILATNESRAST
jgi:hypothetical protein